MIVIAGNVARALINDVSLRVRKVVPYGTAASVLVPRALDLISGRRRSPNKVF